MAQLLISSLISRFCFFCLVLKTINFEFELFIDNLLHLNVFYRSFCVYASFFQRIAKVGRDRKTKMQQYRKRKKNNEKRKWFEAPLGEEKP